MVWTIERRGLLYFLEREERVDEKRPRAMTRAPMARDSLTAAEPKEPVAGAIMIVSPGRREMEERPP